MIYFIFVLAGLFRLYHIHLGVFFEGELGHNYLAIKNFFAQGNFPHLGPPTSHEWLSFGPLFYWIFGPLLGAGGYHPLIGAIFFALVGSMVPVLHFYVARRYFSYRAAILSAILVSASPFLLLVTWQSRFFSLVVPLVYGVLYVLYDKNLSPARRLQFAVLLYSVMLNFHLSPIILLPGLLFHIVGNRKHYIRKDLIIAFCFFLFPHLPLLFTDAQRGFSMTSQILLWFPYRIAGFFGLYPKNTIDAATSAENMRAILHFLQTNTVQVNLYALTAIMCFMLYAVYWKTKKAPLKQKAFINELHIFFFTGLIAIFIHGKPPYHYFLPLVPFVCMYLASTLEVIMQKTKSLAVAALIVLVVVCSNLQSGIPRDNVMSFVEQEKAVQEIITMAEEKQFSLKRVGPDDHFEGDFAQNYRYLLWYYGNEPVDEAQTTFVIHDDGRKVMSIESYKE